MKQYGFGIDIGGTTCKIGLFRTDGLLMDKWEINTNTANDGAFILDDIAVEIEAKLGQLHISKVEVQGIGIGVPGPVTKDGIVHRCVNLGWGVFNVAEEMSRKTGLRVRSENDANIAALGEVWQGAAQGSSDVVMVTIGTGLGCGVVADGKIISGANGAGGEVGHILVNENESEQCSCGNRGCLEQYVSATGIVNMAKRRLMTAHSKTVLAEKTILTAKDIFDAAKSGDIMAEELVNKLGELLGNVLATVACVTNPQTIIIGGGVSKAGQILLDAVKKHFVSRAFHACQNTRLALATLGNDAGIYGGVKLVMEE